MSMIISIVRNLVFLVLLTAFLEMLLPLRETRRYIQVIMGLFVLITVLNPVVSLLKEQPVFSFNTSLPTENQQELQSIISNGEQLQQVNLVDARKVYVNRLEEEVSVLVRLVPGVQSVKARVVLGEIPTLQSLGEVSKVYLTVYLGDKVPVKGVATPVQPVSIGNKQGGDTSQRGVTVPNPGLKSHIMDTVTSLLGLRPEQVIINFTSR